MMMMMMMMTITAAAVTTTTTTTTQLLCGSFVATGTTKESEKWVFNPRGYRISD
jgi:hypothetical protein